MRVRRISFAHLLHGGSEQAIVWEDIGIFREEAENQSSKEVVEVFPPGGGVPIPVDLEEFNVKSVEPAGGLDVKCALTNLLDRGDAGQWQKEAEMVVEVGIRACDRLAIENILSFESLAVRREDELRLVSRGCSTVPKRCEGGRSVAFRANLDVNIVPLEYTAR